MPSPLRLVARIFALWLLCVLIVRAPASAGQSNFNILPTPVAYPYFEPGRTDFKITAAKADLTGNNIDLSGGGAYFIVRRAANEYIAVDGLIGGFGANGDVPGFALPFVFGTSLFTPVIEGKGKLTGFGVPMALDLEVQAIHRPGGSLLFFAGPNISFAGFTVDTPYHAVSGASKAASTQFDTKASVVIGGAQFGAQAGINLGPVTVSPFYMIITQAGSATFTFDDGYRGTDQVQTNTFNIEPYIVNSYGFDVIYRPWNLSVGTLLQSAGSTTNQAGYKLKVIQLTWHFRTN